MANIKPLYQFTIPFEKEVEEVDIKKNEDGSEVRTTRKIKKKFDRTLCLKRATRLEEDDSLLYYSVEVHNGLKAGMVSKVTLAKMYNNDGGVLSKPELEEQNNLLVEYFRRDTEYQQLAPKTDKTSEETQKLESLVREMLSLRRELQKFEIRTASVFDITAEGRARTRTIIWWLVNLAYFDADYEKNQASEEKSYNWQPMFPGNNLEQRLAVKDSLEEGDNLNDDEKIFYIKAIQHTSGATAFWNYGRANTQAEFEAQVNEFTLDFDKKPETLPVPAEEKVAPIEEIPEPENVPKKRGPKPKPKE